MDSSFKRNFEKILLNTLAFFFCLTLVSYYLAANGKINNFPNYLSFLFLLIYLLLNFRELREDISRNLTQPLLMVVFFLFYLCMSILWSPDASLAKFFLYIGYSVLLLSFILSYLICQQKLVLFRIWILPLLILCATVSACYSIYFYYGIEDYQPLDEDRLYALGRLRNPVVGALSYGIAAVISGFYLLFARDITEKAIWGLCLLILMVAIWLTGTRGVWIGLLAVVSIHILTRAEWNYSKKLSALAAMIAVSISVIGIMYVAGGENFIGHRSLSFRPEIWMASLEKLWNYNILWGLGINANSELAHGQLTFQHSHSIYIATLFYGGVAGLMILVGLIWRILKTAFNADQSPESLQKEIALGAFIFGATAFALDGDRLLEKIDFHWIAFWLPVAMIMALGNKFPKNSQSF